MVADRDLGVGRHRVELRFETENGLGGQATLVQDGEVVGTGAIERFTPVAYNEVGIGLTCGYEWGPSVGLGYRPPSPSTGPLSAAEVHVTGPDHPGPGGRGGGHLGQPVAAQTISTTGTIMGRRRVRSPTNLPRARRV